jgi:hypothetical protein
MPSYRIFAIGPDRRLPGAPPAVVECADDTEAVDCAMQLANGLDLEIWQLERIVARLPNCPPKA